MAIKLIQGKDKKAAFKDIEIFECFEARSPRKNGNILIYMKLPVYSYEERISNIGSQSHYVNAVAVCFKSEPLGEITTESYCFIYNSYVEFEDDALVKPVETKFEIIKNFENKMDR